MRTPLHGHSSQRKSRDSMEAFIPIWDRVRSETERRRCVCWRDCDSSACGCFSRGVLINPSIRTHILAQVLAAEGNANATALPRPSHPSYRLGKLARNTRKTRLYVWISSGIAFLLLFLSSRRNHLQLPLCLAIPYWPKGSFRSFDLQSRVKLILRCCSCDSRPEPPRPRPTSSPSSTLASPTPAPLAPTVTSRTTITHGSGVHTRAASLPNNIPTASVFAHLTGSTQSFAASSTSATTTSSPTLTRTTPTGFSFAPPTRPVSYALARDAGSAPPFSARPSSPAAANTSASTSSTSSYSAPTSLSSATPVQASAASTTQATNPRTRSQTILDPLKLAGQYDSTLAGVRAQVNALSAILKHAPAGVETLVQLAAAVDKWEATLAECVDFSEAQDRAIQAATTAEQTWMAAAYGARESSSSLKQHATLPLSPPASPALPAPVSTATKRRDNARADLIGKLRAALETLELQATVTPEKARELTTEVSELLSSDRELAQSESEKTSDLQPAQDIGTATPPTSSSANPHTATNNRAEASQSLADRVRACLAGEAATRALSQLQGLSELLPQLASSMRQMESDVSSARALVHERASLCTEARLLSALAGTSEEGSRLAEQQRQHFEAALRAALHEAAAQAQFARLCDELQACKIEHTHARKKHRRAVSEVQDREDDGEPVTPDMRRYSTV